MKCASCGNEAEFVFAPRSCFGRTSRLKQMAEPGCGRCYASLVLLRFIESEKNARGIRPGDLTDSGLWTWFTPWVWQGWLARSSLRGTLAQ